jgi:hypothetical protein
MSEHKSQPAGEQPPARPNPYNLDEFPHYKAELLKRANRPHAERVEQTFDPKNAEALAILTDPEYSGELSGEEHEAEFETLYPLFDEVQALHEREQHPQSSYLTHWEETADQAYEAGETTMARVSRKNARRLAEVERQLEDKTADLAVGAEWYLRLGSMSRLRGAEDKLVEVAGLPVGKEGSAPYRYSQTEQLLMSGSMYSEASLVNDRYGSHDEARQREYERQAAHQFQAAIDTAGNEVSEQDIARQAKVYLSDLTMREAQRLARQAEGAESSEELMKQATTLAYESIAELQKVIVESRAEMVATNNPDVKSDARGELVERTVLLLLREHAMAGRLTEELPYQAFPRQDYPHDRMVANKLDRLSFDVVQVRSRIVEGERREFEIPLQLKRRQGDQKYARPIVTLASVGDEVEKIAETAIPDERLGPEGARQVSRRLGEVSDALVRRVDNTIVERSRAA